MSDERAFLKAIRAKPGDRTARLVYADWLQERDDPRGELIRIEEELTGLPIHSDRYCELKPRRRELLVSAERPWLKQMCYGSTDYQPVFADVPSGWKERWRLLREFVERWHQIPMQDVGGSLIAVPVDAPGQGTPYYDEPRQSVGDALNNPEVRAGLPPSLCEWMVFIRELDLGLKGFGDGTGDVHRFLETLDEIHFFQQDSGRGCYSIRRADRDEPDPQVWYSYSYGVPPVPVAAHLTTLALHFVVLGGEHEFSLPVEQRMTRPFARRLEKAFPVRSSFDETQIFERPNVIAVWFPQSPFTGRGPRLHIKVRPPANREDVARELWG